jgi:MFS family permease
MTEEPRASKRLLFDTNLRIVFGITLVAISGVSNITPAFPKIVRELQITPQAVGLLITVFTFPGILLTPVLGILADQIGRKKILIPSLLLFGIAGGACALARDFHLLLLLRFIQGIGAAPLGALYVTIIGDLYSGKERAAAMGYNASVLNIGTASYPAIGGALAVIAWYYPFLISLIALPVGGFVLFSLKNPEPKEKPNFAEYLSGVWQSIKHREVIGLFLASVVTFTILFGTYLTCLPLLLGDSFGASALIIGLLMSVSSISGAVMASQLGKLARTFSEGTLIKSAFVLYALTLTLIPFVPALWFFLIPSILFGAAQGMNLPCIQTRLSGLAPINHRAAFMSINGMVLRLGQTLGPLTMGLAMALYGMNGAFFTGAGLAIFMFVFAVILIR